MATLPTPSSMGACAQKAAFAPYLPEVDLYSYRCSLGHNALGQHPQCGLILLPKPFKEPPD